MLFRVVASAFAMAILAQALQGCVVERRQGPPPPPPPSAPAPHANVPSQQDPDPGCPEVVNGQTHVQVPPPADLPEQPDQGTRPGGGNPLYCKGHHEWHGHWDWVGGHWYQAPRHRIWVGGYWTQGRDGWFTWMQGHWKDK